MINQFLRCNLPCKDVNKNCIFPKINLSPEKIRLLLISEAPPIQHSNYYYEDMEGSFFGTTQTAFRDAGIDVTTYDDITKLGIYLTTAIKCSKKDYLVSANTIKTCSYLLEKEISQFPNLKVIMCMGNFAIKAINYITKRKYNKRAIPVGSTYKIRKAIHVLQGIRYFPSYTQTGDSYNIEKIKRQMIAEDIQRAMKLVKFN